MYKTVWVTVNFLDAEIDLVFKDVESLDDLVKAVKATYQDMISILITCTF